MFQLLLVESSFWPMLKKYTEVNASANSSELKIKSYQYVKNRVTDPVLSVKLVFFIALDPC